MKCQPRKVCRKPGFGTGDPVISRTSEPQASTYSCTLYCRYHRFPGTEDPGSLTIQLTRLRIELCLTPRLARREICPRTKMLSFGTQHNGPTIVVSIQHLVSIGDRTDQLVIKKIVWRAVYFYGCHVTI